MCHRNKAFFALEAVRENMLTCDMSGMEERFAKSQILCLSGRCIISPLHSLISQEWGILI